jgi:tetratricopeptide (TPR) repeat protein
MSGRGWLALLVVLFSLSAHADDKSRAREQFRKGSQHFRLGEFADALHAFKEAYRAVEDPSILFNIAQCHRQLNQKSEAIRSYKHYLSEVPRAPNKDEVKKLIAMLETALSHETAARSVPPDGTIGKPQPGEPVLNPPPVDKPVAHSEAQVTARAPERKTPVYKKAWLWAVIGGGVAAVAIGVGLGVGLAPGPSAPEVNAPDGVFRF